MNKDELNKAMIEDKLIDAIDRVFAELPRTPRTTLQRLQAHLATPPKQYAPNKFWKEPAEHVICADGFTLSVQANKSAYSTPRGNFGPYSHVEVWYCGSPAQFSEYGDGSDPYAYVPIEIVCAVIDEHGGFKE